MPLETMDDLVGLLTAPPGDNNGSLKDPKDDEGGGDNSDEHTDPAGDAPGADDGGQGGDPPARDSDASDDDGEEGREGDPEGANPEPFYTVKIDGKEERVTLKEALEGFQRQADYTRKTQEIAAARKVADEEAAAARQQREAYAAVLKTIQDRLGPAEGDLTPEQWNELRARDPGAYAAQWADFQRRQDQRAAVKAEQDRVANEQRQADTKRFAEFVTGEREKLLAALPILKDPAKGIEHQKALREFAVARCGFSEAEVNQAYDHRLLVMLDKAMKWDAHEKSLASAKTKIAGAKPLPEPGARQPLQNPGTAARKAQQAKFNKTGRVEDAVELLFVPKKGPKR